MADEILGMFFRAGLTPACHPSLSPKHEPDHLSLTLIKYEQANTSSPPSLPPDPHCLPDLVCCGLAWPWMAWLVPGLELET